MLLFFTRFATKSGAAKFLSGEVRQDGTTASSSTGVSFGDASEVFSSLQNCGSRGADGTGRNVADTFNGRVHNREEALPADRQEGGGEDDFDEVLERPSFFVLDVGVERQLAEFVVFCIVEAASGADSLATAHPVDEGRNGEIGSVRSPSPSWSPPSTVAHSPFITSGVMIRVAASRSAMVTSRSSRVESAVPQTMVNSL